MRAAAAWGGAILGAAGVSLLLGQGDDGWAAARCLGTYMLAGAALLAAALGAPHRRQVLAEGGGVALGALVGVGLAARAGLTGTQALQVGALLAGAWLLPWSWAQPLRALGLVACARVVCLGSSALLVGTPYLVPPPGGADWADLPGWVAEWNPLARLHGTVIGVDWFHGPLLYGRVGERRYEYPELGEGVLVPAGSALVALLVAWGVAFLWGRRRTRPEEL